MHKRASPGVPARLLICRHSVARALGLHAANAPAWRPLTCVSCPGAGQLGRPRQCTARRAQLQGALDRLAWCVWKLLWTFHGRCAGLCMLLPEAYGSSPSEAGDAQSATRPPWLACNVYVAPCRHVDQARQRPRLRHQPAHAGRLHPCVDRPHAGEREAGGGGERHGARGTRTEACRGCACERLVRQQEYASVGQAQLTQRAGHT